MLKKNKFIPLTDFFPSIFIIGAQKCGTSTLHEWLMQDKRLSFPKFKETHYFSTNYKFGENWYLKQFNSSKKNIIKCEIDPSYLFLSKAIERILENCKSPKFIIILRKPIDRSYSHYLMSKYKGYEKLSFIEALDKEKDRIKRDNFSFINYSYLKRSEYYNQINPLILKDLDCLFVKFEDLFLNDTQLKSIENIYKFIGIEYNDNINFNIISNKAKTYKSEILRNLLYKDNFFKKITRKIITSPYIQYRIKSFFDRMNYKNINTKSNYTQKLPEKYVKWNNEEVIKAEKITKLNLNNWRI